MSPARECRCGCGARLGVGRKYKQGHDLKHVEALAGRRNAAEPGVASEVVEIEARRTLGRQLFVEYLLRTGGTK